MIENCKRSYTNKSVKNQKEQKFVPVLDRNLGVKNAPKLSTKYLGDKICKTKQIKNTLVTLRTFSNQLKTFQKSVTLKEAPPKVPYLQF